MSKQPDDSAELGDLIITPTEPLKRRPSTRDPQSTTPPRFGIIHLLLLTTSAAVTVWSMPKLASLPDSLNQVKHLILIDGLFLGIIPSALSLFGTTLGLFLGSVFLLRETRREQWPIEPGAWLGLAACFAILPRIIYIGTSSAWHLAFAQASGSVIAGVLLMSVALATRMPRNWKLTFLILPQVLTIPALGILLRSETLALSLLAFVPIAAFSIPLAAATADLFRVRHTWMHRMGLAAWLGVMAARSILLLTLL
ncbi:MAG: hypothetical protein KDA47_22525 [Planctomycetales bacterium]|nr:hypothetical protein [Planctomycetales bacterium]